jgi:hypothetical protein
MVIDVRLYSQDILIIGHAFLGNLQMDIIHQSKFLRVVNG